VDPAALRGIDIQVWHAFAGGAADIFASQVAQFNSTNEWGIHVTPAAYGDYPSLYDAVTTAIDSGTAPDLAATLPEQALAWHASGAVVDLTAYLRDAAWGLDENALADFPSAFWSQDATDGLQLGVPAQRSARFLFYNATWARELGFDQPPETSDDFRRQACAANAFYRSDADLSNDGYGGWIVDADWQTTYSWLLAFGGGALAGTTYGFRTDPNLAALQFLKGLYDDHCAWLSTDPTPFDPFAHRLALFISGDLAEIPLVAGAMSRLGSRDDWTLIPFPGTNGRALVAYGPSYTVLTSTPEKQLAAWLFARWLLMSQNQAPWVEAAGTFPLRLSVLDQVGPYRAASPQWEAAVGYLPLAQGVPHLASWRKVRYVLEDGVTALFQSNTPLDQIPALLTDMDAMAAGLNK
jgi:ABC-type glycerol-3-phosphate transport system substrate-binding protein